MNLLLRTPPKKWHVAVLTLILWLGSILTLFARVYAEFQSDINYDPEWYSVWRNIDINTSLVAWLIATPFVGLFFWLVLRNYRGGLSFWTFDTGRPWRCVIVPIAWAAFAMLIFLVVRVRWLLLLSAGWSYVDEGQSNAELVQWCVLFLVRPRIWVEPILGLAWVYLFLCLRSSFCAPKT